MPNKRDIAKKIADKYFNDKDIWNGLFGTDTTGGPANVQVKAHTNDEKSFIFQATKGDIFVRDVQPLIVDAPGNPATGDPNAEVDDWYYYVFDWRNFQNITPDAQSYVVGGNLADYFKQLAIASMPYAVRLWGKKMTVDGGTPINMATWYNDNIQFGGYEVEVRADAYTLDDGTPLPDAPPNHLSQINPGLTFLIGIRKDAIKALDPDRDVTIDMDTLAPETDIIMRIGSIDDDFGQMVETLKLYHFLREEIDTSFEVEPIKFDFEDEAEHIADFKSALKSLLLDAVMEGMYLPDTDPEHLSNPEIEDYAKHPRLWNKPDNIIQISLTNKWEVSYIREYVPKSSFKKEISTVPGLMGIKRLGKVKAHRIIGGGLSPSLKKYFEEFKNEDAVRSPRTVALISKMHERNGRSGGIKPQLGLDPKKNVPILNIIFFIKQFVLGKGKFNSTIKYKSDDAKKYFDKVAVYLEKNGSALASRAQRGQANARTNNPSWAASYEHYTKNWLVNTTDDFWQNLPETRDRLRIDEAWPYGLDAIFNEVLQEADVKRLVLEAIKCWLDPTEWLELACMYALKQLPIDSWFEWLQKDGTLAALQTAANVSNQVSNSFKTIANEKRIKPSEFGELENEREKYNNQILTLLNKREKLQNKLNKANAQTTGGFGQVAPSQQTLLQNKIKSINLKIENRMGLRQQVEMDSHYGKWNQSTGNWVPISEEGAQTAAAAADGITGAIMDLQDPDFKRKLCANIISYSIKATQMLVDLFRTTENAESGIKKIEKAIEEMKEMQQPRRPKLATDNSGMWLTELVRKAVAEAVATAALFFVKKLLSEIVEACNRLKDSLWNDLNQEDENKINKTPGKARFNDLLAETPTAAARDLTATLAGFIDVTDPNAIADLLGLMEDLELLLSQIELCALAKGEASISVLKIVKNLIQIRYNTLYLSLKGERESLPFSKIKNFFESFLKDKIKAGYCEEIQKPGDPLQLYQECPPYIRTLCGDLLVGHCTNEQIDNICKKAKIERLDKLVGLIDTAYNPTPFPDPRDCNSPNAIPHDVYPTNVRNAKMTDRNLRPVIGTFRSEIFGFSNKLLYGSADGVSFLTPQSGLGGLIQDHVQDGANWSPGHPLGSASDKLGTAAEEGSKIIRQRVLLPLWNRLGQRPMRWLPGEASKISDIFSNFLLHPLANNKIEYYIIDHPNSPQIVDLTYTDGCTTIPPSCITKGPITYLMKNGKIVFLPIARIEKFMNLYGGEEPNIKEGKLILGSFEDEFDAIQESESLSPGPDMISRPEGLFHASPMGQLFYETIEDAWPSKSLLNAPEPDPSPSPGGGTATDPDDFYGATQTQGGFNTHIEEGLKFLFNTMTRDIGNSLFKKIQDSKIFSDEAREKLQLFFNTFFPKEVFLADESCDVEEASLLKMGDLKDYVRDREKDLSCNYPPVDLNEETPNLSRAQAEAIVMVLARICAFETGLRLLPISTSIKMKDLLSSEAVINVVVEHLIYELAMLDYRVTYKTLSAKEQRDLEKLKPGKSNFIDPHSGKLIYAPSDTGEERYIEEPPTPVIASENGEPFKPKFQAHVVHYANRIMQDRMQKQLKNGKVLIDPLTKEDYIHPDDLYSLSGITYLIKEQMIRISDFFEREFEPLFSDLEIKSFDRFVLELFLHEDATNSSSKAFGGDYLDLWQAETQWYPPTLLQTSLTSKKWWTSKHGTHFQLFNLMPSINSWSLGTENYISNIIEELKNPALTGQNSAQAAGAFGPGNQIAYEISDHGFAQNIKSRILMNQRFYDVALTTTPKFWEWKQKNADYDWSTGLNATDANYISGADAHCAAQYYSNTLTADCQAYIEMRKLQGVDILDLYPNFNSATAASEKYSMNQDTLHKIVEWWSMNNTQKSQAFKDVHDWDAAFNKFQEDRFWWLNEPMDDGGDMGWDQSGWKAREPKLSQYVDGKRPPEPFDIGKPNEVGVISPTLMDYLKVVAPEEGPDVGRVAYMLTDFAKRAGFENGGFILEPYIRVKQHTQFGEGLDIDLENEQAIKEQLAAEAYKKVLKEAPAKLNQRIQENCQGEYADPKDKEECEDEIRNSWHITMKQEAQAAYNNVINKPINKSLPTIAELPSHLGDVWRGDGAYINIAHWLNYMSGVSGFVYDTEDSTIGDPFNLRFSDSIIAKSPHTQWFDPWMYGLRLVYIAPLDTGVKYTIFSDNNFKLDKEEFIHDGWRNSFHADDVYGVGTSAEPEHDPLNIKNKKAYVLHERINLGELGIKSENFMAGHIAQGDPASEEASTASITGDFGEVYIRWPLGTQYVGPSPSVAEIEQIASPPIFAVPLMEVEIPVGNLTFDEKLLAKKLAMDAAYKNALNKFETIEAAEEEKETVGLLFEKEFESAVPVGYFTFQNWNLPWEKAHHATKAEQDQIPPGGLDDYPLEQLLCAMVKTEEFDTVFGKIFPLETYKTLIGLYLLIQTYTLQADNPTFGEYSENPGSRYSGLFEGTKGLLRGIFYSNTLAHDPTQGNVYPMAGTEVIAARAQDASPSDLMQWLNLMCGVPPSYAKLLAMTPLAILKSLVTIIDPKWASFPWTVPGLVMFLLSQKSGLGAAWFADDSSKAGDQPKALVCPDMTALTAQQKSSKDYTNEEVEFMAMMRSYAVPEADRNYILNTPYKPVPAQHWIIAEVGWEGGPEIFVDTAYPASSKDTIKYFSDTPLFQVLMSAWRDKGDHQLKQIGIIFNNLKEFYDLYIEIHSVTNQHFESYYQHVLSVLQKNAHEGEWHPYQIAKIFISCAKLEGKPTGNESPWKTNTVCKYKTKYGLANTQLSMLKHVFNTILGQIDLSYTEEIIKLKGPHQMKVRSQPTNVVKKLFYHIKFGDASKFDINASDEETITSLLQHTLESEAIASVYLEREELSHKIADTISNLVWNNEALFLKSPEQYNSGIAMSQEAQDSWKNTPSNPIDFNTSDTVRWLTGTNVGLERHSLRSFWLKGPESSIQSTPTWHGALGYRFGAEDDMQWIFDGVMGDPSGPFALSQVEDLYQQTLTTEGTESNAEYTYDTDPEFTYAGNIVGYVLDALVENRQHGEYHAGHTIPGFGQDLVNKYILAPPTAGPAHFEPSAPQNVRVYDMHNIEDHVHIANLWTASQHAPWVVDNRGPNELQENTPQSEWKFANMNAENYLLPVPADLWIKDQTTFGSTDFGMPKYPTMYLDWVAWYYPSLATVIAELLYKMYNIKLKTAGIAVYEERILDSDSYKVHIHTKNMHGYIRFPFEVNKKANANDTQVREFPI